MSQTRKDLRHGSPTVLLVVGRDDGNFDLFVNGKLEHSCVEERWLPEQLCVRYGFCGQEYEQILREVAQNGKKEIRF